MARMFPGASLLQGIHTYQNYSAVRYLTEVVAYHGYSEHTTKGGIDVTV